MHLYGSTEKINYEVVNCFPLPSITVGLESALEGEKESVQTPKGNDANGG